ncbi:MAG: tyrosine-type recombinase/integrase [Armatimonadetes bacterium]|nr:tyrosine-type recombinase/integrase [Armatimonadota bacterium]
MAGRAPRTTTASIPTNDLARCAPGWILDGEVRQLSKRTLEARRFLVDNLLWFLHQQEAATCGAPEVRAFLAYLNRGHEEPGGRWGNPRARRPVRPRTAQTYFTNLRTLFNFLVVEGYLEASPLETLRPPVARADQIQPFTQDEVAALLDAARLGRHRRRDEALALFLLDTGAHASEVCSLRIRDLDFQGRGCTVTGKGNKQRRLYFGARTMKALWAYLTEEARDPEEPLFTADSCRYAGDGLTRFGLRQTIVRLGRRAGITRARCSPHTFRHTFAVEFLRAGGNVFTLRELLGPYHPADGEPLRGAGESGGAAPEVQSGGSAEEAVAQSSHPL